MSQHSTASIQSDLHDELRDIIAHFAHVLPGQAPIKDFVHHNTLHGYQHLQFEEALAQSYQLTGAKGYIPLSQFQAYLQQGRVTNDDLQAVLAQTPDLQADQILLTTETQSISRQAVYLIALTQSIKPLTGSQLNWLIDEEQVLQHLQPQIPASSRSKLLATAKNEKTVVATLWQACLEKLQLTHYIQHPEDLFDMPPEQAEQMLNDLAKEEELHDPGTLLCDRKIRRESYRLLHHLLDSVGDKITLRGLLLQLTGQDIHDSLRPQLQRQIASHLDQGMAAWHSRDREQGFYLSWLRSAERELSWIFEELPSWRDYLKLLPENPLDTIIMALRQLGLKKTRWGRYLKHLALEFPGWSGMFFWRSQRPGYQGDHNPVEMADYLAVRLVLEHLFATRLCRQQWNIEPSIDMLRWHFHHYPAELYLRHTLFSEQLPDYLATHTQTLLRQARNNQIDDEREQDWQRLAHQVWTWQHARHQNRYTVHRDAWLLFLLAQHLGLSGEDIHRLEDTQINDLFDCFAQMTGAKAGYLRLQAFERHYREQILNAIAANQGKGLWRERKQRPQAQIMVCMDDREEGLRRYIEELNPQIETLGAAGYFNMTINWQALDHERVTALCPVTQVPANDIIERPVTSQQATAEKMLRNNRRRNRLRNLIQQETRRNTLGNAILVSLCAPAALFGLLGKMLAPRQWHDVILRFRQRLEPAVETRIKVTATDENQSPSVENPIEGFLHEEQLDRLEKFLRSVGMVNHFAPLVLMMGHGSNSQNNPHFSAYGCGACSGRYSGPNGRVFAAMMNRPEIRQALEKRGITVPDDTWFIGAEHNTCDEKITCYDTELIPESLQTAYQALQKTLNRATQLHAQERIRRFASASLDLTPQQAAAHVRERMLDFSQARPELGHACNAVAVIGRRALTRGIFLDRRAFLISYDPAIDPEGHILEAVLLEVGPVGAGISLEYYFSTVDNDNYGCGSKITHNVTGLFGVMEGSNSDLRTGLPKQMIEIHEAMRLQVVIEASPDVLTAIVARQPPLQSLILNRWIQVISVHPDNGDMQLFDPDQGFVSWQANHQTLESVTHSQDWCKGHRDALPPAIITAANITGAAS